MERDMSEDMERAIRLAHRIVNHAKVDREFERNAEIRRKIYGVVICLLSIFSQVVVGEIWWALETIPMVTMGLLILSGDFK